MCASLAHRTLLMAPTARFPPSPAAPRRTTRSHLERSRSRPRLEVTDAPECFDTTAFRENREVRWSSRTLGRAPTSRGRPGALLGRYGRATRLLRAVRAHDISQHLPISPHISPYLPISYLPISPHISGSCTGTRRRLPPRRLHHSVARLRPARQYMQSHPDQEHLKEVSVVRFAAEHLKEVSVVPRAFLSPRRLAPGSSRPSR